MEGRKDGGEFFALPPSPPGALRWRGGQVAVGTGSSVLPFGAEEPCFLLAGLSLKLG